MKFNKAYTFFLRLYTEGAGSKRPLPNPWATIGKAEHDADKREGRPTTKKKQYPRPTSLETGGPANMSEDGETDSIPRETVDEFHRELDELVHKYLGHSSDEMEGEVEEDAEGKIDKDRMKCNSPKRTSGGSKKFVVKACKDGKEKIVRFGDPNMKIKKSNPKRRKSFRARHKCDQKKDKFSAAYWSCKKW